MEVLEHVAAVLGIICSFSAVFTICSKSAKAFIANMFKKYGHDENMVRIEEKLDLMNNKLDSIEALNTITVDFTREECRDKIKTMFYQYYDEKTLPLYEYKWLLKLETFYVDRLHGNSFVKGLINTMKTWPIDYSKTHAEEDE